MPATLLAVLLAATASPHPKVAVLELESDLGANPKLAHLVTTLVTTELRKRPELQITSQQEIQTLLGFERQKQLLGCTQANCMAEIGGALGVDDIVNGSIAQLGESLLLTLRFVEVRKAHVVREATRRLRDAKADAVLDVIPDLVAELLGEAPAPAPTPPVAPPTAAVAAPAPAAAPAAAIEQPAPPVEHRRSSGPYWLMGVGGAVLVAGIVVTSIEFATAASPKTVNGVSQYPLTESAASTNNTVAYIGDAAAAVGGAIGLSGLGWLIFRPAAAPTVDSK